MAAGVLLDELDDESEELLVDAAGVLAFSLGFSLDVSVELLLPRLSVR